MWILYVFIAKNSFVIDDFLCDSIDSERDSSVNFWVFDSDTFCSIFFYVLKDELAKITMCWSRF